MYQAYRTWRGSWKEARLDRKHNEIEAMPCSKGERSTSIPLVLELISFRPV